jgi:hypothetical protein
MPVKKINEKPKITDEILFEIETPDANGCFSSNPYRVDQVVIYFIERSFISSTNFGEYQRNLVNEDLLIALAEAKKAFCESPTIINQIEVEKLMGEISSNQTTTNFFFKDARPTEIIGSPDFPAWLSTDPENSALTLVSEDESGNPQYGRFTFLWRPEGRRREGDYFICWTWTPLPAGDKLSSHIQFNVFGDTKVVQTLPIHETNPIKYETLLERYLPEMYKAVISQRDKTPQTTQRLNKAIGDGFTMLENLGNQIVDLFDANVLHESMLTFLSNLFQLKLKSDDPALWRRQIKRAVPLFKKKGTKSGLKEAFAQSGMEFLDCILYWQVVSPYTWQESFRVTTSACFTLYQPNIVLPIDPNNFELALRRQGADEYVIYGPEYVTFNIDEKSCEVEMCWIGDELSANPVELMQGDIIRVLYQYAEIPDAGSQALENYIRALPLSDTRDEVDQSYPLKNWNVRLIDEDDPLFNVVVPVKHPYHDNLVFGKVRTEFPYSENIYNMEEYNGSTRDSHDACSIDKNFIDPCGGCASSKFSIIVGIEELSNHRIEEALDVVNEYKPFHAVLHSIGFDGVVEEFIISPVERIESLVTIDRVQNIISGNKNAFFNRSMPDGLTTGAIDRDALSNQMTVLSGKLGTAYNEQIDIITPTYAELDDVGVAVGRNILEVLSPSLNAGTYELGKTIYKNRARVVGSPPEPLDTAQFTFNLSNINRSVSTAEITQENLYEFGDDSVSFEELGVKGNWDIVNSPDYSGGAWQVEIPAYSSTYIVDDIINGKLILVDDGSLPIIDTSGISYTLKDDTSADIVISTTGSLEVKHQARVDLNDPGLVNITDIANIGHMLYYAGDEYEIVALDGLDFIISGWTGGNIVGASVEVRKRLMTQEVGIFAYNGMKLITFANHEVEFEMINGANPPPENARIDDSKFKENFLFKIDNQLFKIAQIDGDLVTLEGPPQSWKTLASGGTVKAYQIIHFENQTVSIGFTVFDHLDRRGKDPVIREIEDSVSMDVAIVALSSNRGDGGFDDLVHQEESVGFQIQYRDGNTEEGEV